MLRLTSNDRCPPCVDERLRGLAPATSGRRALGLLLFTITDTMANPETPARDDQVQVMTTGAIPLQGEYPCQAPHRLYEQQLRTAIDDLTDQDVSQMQVWWNQAMSREMKVPVDYSNVAVLIIKWTEKLDGLNCTKEVRSQARLTLRPDDRSLTWEQVGDLDDLFRQRFGYTTKVVELSNDAKPQLQLNHAVAEFVLAHDGQHNLLILYYTGHAEYHNEENYLELIGYSHPFFIGMREHRSCRGKG